MGRQDIGHGWGMTPRLARKIRPERRGKAANLLGSTPQVSQPQAAEMLKVSEWSTRIVVAKMGQYKKTRLTIELRFIRVSSLPWVGAENTNVHTICTPSKKGFRAKNPRSLDVLGGPSRNRTANLLIKSQFQ
jgi:hypothetical protein